MRPRAVRVDLDAALRAGGSDGSHRRRTRLGLFVPPRLRLRLDWFVQTKREARGRIGLREREVLPVRRVAGTQRPDRRVLHRALLPKRLRKRLHVALSGRALTGGLAMGRRVERGYPRRRRERRRLRLGVRGQLDEGVAAAEGFGDQGFMRDETEAMAADARARRFIFRSRFIFFFFRRRVFVASSSRVARFDRPRGGGRLGGGRLESLDASAGGLRRTPMRRGRYDGPRPAPPPVTGADGRFVVVVLVVLVVVDVGHAMRARAVKPVAHPRGFPGSKEQGVRLQRAGPVARSLRRGPERRTRAGTHPVRRGRCRTRRGRHRRRRARRR